MWALGGMYVRASVFRGKSLRMHCVSSNQFSAKRLYLEFRALHQLLESYVQPSSQAAKQ